MIDPIDLTGRRVTVMGLGRHGGGVAAARYLAEQGAVVTVTDVASAEELAASLTQLADVRIERYQLGGHRREDFQTADLVVVNPAVRPGNPYVEAAIQAGATITSETELFLRACPARMVGVTGSNGKSTTASMIAAILAAADRRAFLGGNIGVSLLPQLSVMQADDVAVVELSSFQLHWLSPTCPLPEVAVVVNCTPNHLDWHGTYEHYVRSKQRLLATSSSSRESCAILNPLDPEVASWSRIAGRRQLALFNESELPPLLLPGAHNRANALCAATAAQALGCSESAIVNGLRQFQGLTHRLQLVAEIAGRKLVDDSKSTTPEATRAALAADAAPTWLLAGGVDKGVDLRPLANSIVESARGLATFGRTGPTLLELVQQTSPNFEATDAGTLPAALAWCWQRSKPGDRILLSPACASFDQFRDFVHRSEVFRELVHALHSVGINSAAT